MKRALVPLLLSVGIVLLGVLRVAMLWSELPTTVASHFGPSGEADAFMHGVSFLSVLGAITAVTLVSLSAAPLWLRLVPPALVNVPHRDYWSSTPERRREARERVGHWTAWFGVPTMALLVIALELSLQANLAGEPLDNRLFLLALGAYGAVSFVLVVGLFRSLRPPEVEPIEVRPES